MKKKLIEMPLELFKKVEKKAIKDNRSVNKEIVHLVKKGLDEK